MPDANLSDQLADTITTHNINVLRVSAGLRANVLTMLKKLQGTLLGDLEEHGPNPRLTALLRQTEESIDSAYRDISDSHLANLEDIARAETEQAANLVDHAIGVETMTTGQTPRMITTIASKTLLEGHYPAQWWSGQADDLKTRFEAQMREGMLRGESIDQLAQRVRGTASNGYQNGIMQASRAQAEALVRTSVMSVANESRINTYRSNADVVKGIQWLSTLDSRTTAICRALDGLQWDLDYRPIGHNKAFPGPIAHWGCRSTQIPITKSWSELSGKKVGVDDDTLNKLVQDKAKAAGMDPTQADKLVARTRASMDGQVAAKMTFGDWVDGKSHPEQDQILGTQQAQLWRAGKITMADLTDQANRPLTVGQLQKLAVTKQLVPAQTYAPNQGGLTLHARTIAEDQLATMQATGNESTTFLNDDTGHTVSFQNSLPTADHEDKIQAIDASTVVKTALQDSSLLSATEARIYEKMGIDDLKIVRLDGSTLNVTGSFSQQATDILVAKLATSTTKDPEKKLIDALRQAGFKVSRTKPGNVQVQIPQPLGTNLAK